MFISSPERVYGVLYYGAVNFLLVLFGVLLLLVSLATIGLGLFMASNPKTRKPGGYFALWWVPAAAAATGVIMRDGVTVFVGTLCFLVAGAMFAFEGKRPRPAPPRGEPSGRGRPGGGTPIDATDISERTTRENVVDRRRKAS